MWLEKWPIEDHSVNVALSPSQTKAFTYLLNAVWLTCLFRFQKSYSTEELAAEMANLEGLVKDLTAITQQEFEC